MEEAYTTTNLLDTENEKLKKENEELKTENKELKIENEGLAERNEKLFTWWTEVSFVKNDLETRCFTLLTDCKLAELSIMQLDVEITDLKNYTYFLLFAITFMAICSSY